MNEQENDRKPLAQRVSSWTETQTLVWFVDLALTMLGIGIVMVLGFWGLFMFLATKVTE